MTFYDKDIPNVEGLQAIKDLVKMLDSIYPSGHDEWIEFFKKINREETIK